MLLIIATQTNAIDFSSPQVKSLSEKHKHEIAVEVIMPYQGTIEESHWKACIPQISEPFPEELTEEHKAEIFTKSELSDLKKCKVGSCKFKFLEKERQKLSKLKTERDMKTAYFHFFQDRASGKTGIDPDTESFFIRSDDKLFDICHSPVLDHLLDDRPIADLPYRLSIVQYEERMRPTSRLTQGVHFKNENGKACYAEALLFSDHYDVERVELWQKTSEQIRVRVRHRLDFLNSWWRRLHKGRFRSVLEDQLKRQMNQAQKCLQKAS